MNTKRHVWIYCSCWLQFRDAVLTKKSWFDKNRWLSSRCSRVWVAENTSVKAQPQTRHQLAISVQLAKRVVRAMVLIFYRTVAVISLVLFIAQLSLGREVQKPPPTVEELIKDVEGLNVNNVNRNGKFVLLGKHKK